MNKKMPALHPLLTVASACVFPIAVLAQGATQQPSQPAQPAQPAQPSTPSVPSTPSMPTTPSQPAGVPYPSSIYFPGSVFQPAGTQASSVTEELPTGLQLRAIAGFEHEDNVLRSSVNEISDTAFLLGVGLRADRRFGLQRLRADVEANTYRYADESSLDYNVFNYALAWDWSLTPRFRGTLAADQKQYREVVTDPFTLENRVGRRTERAELAEGLWEVGGALRAVGSFGHTRSKSSLPNSWDANPDVYSARVGLGWELPSGTSVYGRYRRGDGEYTDPSPGAASGDFKENEFDVLVKWPVSGKTSVDARLGYLDREHDSGTQTDFSGLVGNAAVAWDVTGKTRVIAGVSRDLNATGLASGGHVQNDRIYIGPTWKATALLAVNLRFDHVSRDWKDVPAGSVEAGRSESVRVLSAGVEWQPRRWLAVSGYVRNERQDSNLNAGYRNTTIGAAVKGFF